jgi:hypothetical protein
LRQPREHRLHHVLGERRVGQSPAGEENTRPACRRTSSRNASSALTVAGRQQFDAVHHHFIDRRPRQGTPRLRWSKSRGYARIDEPVPPVFRFRSMNPVRYWHGSRFGEASFFTHRLRALD